MDQKRVMMSDDIAVRPKGRLNIAKSPANSVSMTQLFRDKNMTGAVPNISEPSLAMMYYTYMIQQPSTVPKGLFDHKKKKK